ncbi:unnamed protein product [Prunus brigantina]
MLPSLPISCSNSSWFPILPRVSSFLTAIEMPPSKVVLYTTPIDPTPIIHSLPSKALVPDSQSSYPEGKLLLKRTSFPIITFESVEPSGVLSTTIVTSAFFFLRALMFIIDTRHTPLRITAAATIAIMAGTRKALGFFEVGVRVPLPFAEQGLSKGAPQGKGCQ